VNKTIKICIISSQILEYEKIGGFGSMTKQLASSLAGKEFDVMVTVLRRGKQKRVKHTDGYTIIRLSRMEAINPFVYRRINADIYHSQNPNLMSAAAMIGTPHKNHVITCRDPRDLKDWYLEIRDATWRRKLKNLPLIVF